MDRTERFYRIDQLLHELGVVPRQTFLDDLEVSLATFKRDLEYMRDRFNAPVVWDGEAGGYRYDKQSTAGPRFALPGLWFSEREAFALVMMEHLLSSLDQGGLIGPHIAPLRSRLTAILGTGEASAAEVRKRVKLLSFAPRKLALDHFEEIGRATIKRQRIHIAYYARSTDQVSERDVSPQRLVHYRGNWYLDGWCHVREGLRRFAVDRILEASVLPGDAFDISDTQLDQQFGAVFGIFSGPPTATAVLRFSPVRARWVADEVWPGQCSARFLGDGRYELHVAYGDPTELLMEILKHVPDVEVLEPESLRRAVVERLQSALKLFSSVS
jgi:predicted DNA-binding transcriptional regulator YafY